MCLRVLSVIDTHSRRERASTNQPHPVQLYAPGQSLKTTCTNVSAAIFPGWGKGEAATIATVVASITLPAKAAGACSASASGIATVVATPDCISTASTTT
eukprot:scaffold62949_cov66-Phaeocystis_antarctica.AAC.2